MATTVFIDSGYYIALLFPRDQWHTAAKHAALLDVMPATSSLVVSETLLYLQNKGAFSIALAFLRDLRTSTEIRMIYPDQRLQADAWDLFERYGGSGASAVDCTSFAIMHSLGIRKAFTFDRHFSDAGFETLRPSR